MKCLGRPQTTTTRAPFGDTNHPLKGYEPLRNERKDIYKEIRLFFIKLIRFSFFYKKPRLGQIPQTGILAPTARFSIFHSYSFGIRMENDKSRFGHHQKKTVDFDRIPDFMTAPKSLKNPHLVTWLGGCVYHFPFTTPQKITKTLFDSCFEAKNEV